MLDSAAAGDISAVRDHTRELIAAAFDSTEPALIEAPPSSGKTTSTYDLAIDSETPVTYLCSRIDLYEEATEHFRQAEDAVPHFEGCRITETADTETATTYAVIPSPYRDCPSFQEGEPGNETLIRKKYASGMSAYKLHMSEATDVVTPCGSDCPYMQKLRQIDYGNDSIDILIGHHKHSHRESYVRDRIVVLDEFNADAFLTEFPDVSTETRDDPCKTIPNFLNAVDGVESSFPTQTFSDITDILVKRFTHEDAVAAIEWFRSHGVSRGDAEEFDFLTESLFQYDNTHLLAPFLTFSLFCMEPLGNDIEMAPHPNNDHLQLWEDVGLSPSTRVIRDRNTNQMSVLRPPDISLAKQVIGLDGLPTPELWDLLLPPDSSFSHQQVLEKSDFISYLKDGLNMSLTQVGDGMYHYAGGRVSTQDGLRLRAITLIEDAPVPVISTKRALDGYQNDGLLYRYVAETSEHEDTETNFEYESLLARNFASVKSSNEFEQEDLGVVMGTPYPGDDVVRRWAGLCGRGVEVSNTGEERTFGEFGDKIYQHLTHNQVVQAILRFGRDESVYEEDGAQVYVSTKALPEWFEMNNTLDICTKTTELAVVKALRSLARKEDKQAYHYRTVKILTEDINNSDRIEDHITENQVRRELEELVKSGFVIVKRNHGKGGADCYRWDLSTSVRIIEENSVICDQRVYLVDTTV